MSTISAGTTTPTALSLSGDTTGALTFQVNGTTTAATITSAGNVGIGTASPVQLLTVESTGNVRATIRNSTENTSYASSLDFATGSGSLSSSNVVGRVQGIITQADPSTLQSALAFHTNSGDSVTEKMRIAAGGNVGIGSTTPGTYSERLVIQSTAGTQSSAMWINPGQGSGQIGIAASGRNFKIYNTYTDGLLANGKGIDIDDNGNVGIGTTTIGAGGTATRLQVANANTASVGTQANLMVTTTDAQAANVGGIIGLGGSVTTASPTANMRLFGAIRGAKDDATDGGTNGYMAFYTMPSSSITATERMRITSGGNVGIGTASPGTKFEVYEAGGGPIIRMATSVTGTGSGNGFSLGIDGSGGAYVTQNENQPLYFYTNNTERMQITGAGFVSIGRAPTATIRLFVQGSTTGSSDYTFACYNSSEQNLFYVRNDGAFSTGTASLSPYNLTTGNAANVYLDAAGVLNRSTSSLRYKTDIADATHGLADVLKLRSVTYKGKNDGDKTFGGLIAEEVHDAGLTEFVAYDKDGQPDALHYGNMVALAFKAIQELKAENDALKARIEALESK